MAEKEGGAGDLMGGRRRDFLSGAGAKLRDSWLARHWQSALVLALIVLLAFFVRSYFSYSISIDNGYLVSGGSDSYYHERAIDYVTSTGEHLFMDPMLNYPFGMRNPRLPLYDWSVAVSGMIFSAFSGAPVADGTGLMLVLSTAFWGSLTVIPVYLIGKAAFGRRAGLVSGFLFALMPGHIERSVLSNADHDSMMLFFAVWGFYFLLEALIKVKGDRWVQSYGSLKGIKDGLLGYVKLNRVSLIYAMLAGVCLTAVAFAWEGYMYLLIIILVYFLVQIFVNRFKNIDSLGVFMTMTVMLGTLFILAAPMYRQLLLWNTWFDMPLLLFAGMVVVGLIFVLTRDYPWTLVVPSFIILVVAALAVLSVVAPALFDAIVTGQGYLVKSKLYSTIGEAQAPSFSVLALSFGALTFWLGFVGLVWAAIRIPKNLAPHYIFLVVWIGTALFMAMSAGRFLFNAAPAFAISAGWIVVLLIQMAKFEDLPKGLAGFRLRNPLLSLRKGVKVRHLLGAIFLAFLIILPNVWMAVDAGMPTQVKREYDLQVYDHLPQIMRPADYDSINGSYWYFGAFSYGLPMPNDYFPAAWSWLSEQDNDINPPYERPAFLSWWDYGFEAIQAGQHPTVADDFQNGYNFAGSFITCTDEAQGVAMLVALAIQKGQAPSTIAQVDSILVAHGVDLAKVKDIMYNPSKYISIVMSNPEIYGPFDMDNTVPSALNARYVALRVELAKLGLDELASVYNELRQVTGVDVGYFAVDTRLFPFSATSGNVFYAPAKLSDRRIDPASNAPIDFYKIMAVDSNGNLVDIANITADMIIVDYQIIYKNMFYESMLYRAFMGFGPTDLGLTTQGLPGLSGSLASYRPMQGWNMNHFRLVYKTAYFNPYPREMVQNHSEAWRAVSYEEAKSLEQQINDKLIDGVVDYSASTLTKGIVFIQYYDGVIIEGKATTSSGNPYPDAYVTVLDEYDTPHMTVKTDSDGHYRVLAPFGKVNVVFSTGELDKLTQIATEIGRKTFDFTYDQAMRKQVDSDQDGIFDYLVDGNIVLPSSTVSGKLFWDLDGSGSLNSNDQAIVGAKVVLQNTTTGFRLETTSTVSGFSFAGVPPMGGEVYAVVEGHQGTAITVTVKSKQDVTVDIAIKPASIGGKVVFGDNSPASDLLLQLLDSQNGNLTVQFTGESGSFNFEKLLPGNYTLQTGQDGFSLGQQVFALGNGDTVTRTFTLYEAMSVSGQILTPSLTPAANATVALLSSKTKIWTQTDSQGRFHITVSSDSYTLLSLAVINGRDYAALLQIPATVGQTQANPTLSSAFYVSGKLVGDVSLDGVKVQAQSRTTGAKLTAVANSTGEFRMLLPSDLYFFYVDGQVTAYWNDAFIATDAALILSLVSSARITGTVWYDNNGDGLRASSEGRTNVTLTVADADGRSITTLTDSTGYYSLNLVPNRYYTLLVNENGYAPQEFSYSPLTGNTQQDIQLLAYNRTVSGVVSYLGSRLPGITVTFTSTGSGARTATAISDGLGRFTLSLHPGNYNVVVVQNATFGSNATQYQSSQSLSVQIGKDPSGLAIDVVRRVLVTGTLTPERAFSARVVISGPDSMELRATTDFTTYLQEGTYEVYASQERFASRFASLGSYVISPSSNTITINTEQAYTVTGSIYYEGSRLMNLASVKVTMSTGGSYTLQSTLAGTFTLNLPAGTYNITTDARSKQYLDTQTERYFRYLGYLNFDLTANKDVTVNVKRILDNTTIIGQIIFSDVPVAAQMQFVATSLTAVNATAEASSSGFDLGLAPGNYSVYIKQLSGVGAFLGKLDVRPYVVEYINFTLVAGIPFSGVTLVNGIPASALVEISSLDYLSLRSDASGGFEVYLPSELYQVKATASGQERGVTVSYVSELALNLTSPQSRTISLVKVPKRLVSVQWDSSEKRTINGGESVVYNIRIVNKGNVPDTYRLGTIGSLSGWTMTLSESTVTVDFGQQNSQLVTLTITAPVGAKVSHQSLSVRATSTELATITNSATVEVGIAPVHAVSITYTKPLTTSGSSFSYSLSLKNTGNVDDSFLVSVVDLAGLQDLGWKAEVRSGTGAFGSNVTIPAMAGNSVSFELRLTPVRANPEPSITVVLTGTSVSTPTASTVLPFQPELPKFTIPSGGLAVTGDKVSSIIPDVPAGTMMLLGLVLAMFTVFVLVGMQKGVFRRRKR